MTSQYRHYTHHDESVDINRENFGLEKTQSRSQQFLSNKSLIIGQDENSGLVIQCRLYMDLCDWGRHRQACSPLTQLFFGFASESRKT